MERSRSHPTHWGANWSRTDGLQPFSAEVLQPRPWFIGRSKDIWSDGRSSMPQRLCCRVLRRRRPLSF